MQLRTVSGLPFADSPILVALATYWSAKRSSRAMPDRADIDPLDMPRGILPHIGLIDCLPDGDFSYRLVGTELVERFGVNLTGRRISAMTEEPFRQHAMRIFSAAAQHGRPLYVESAIHWDGDRPAALGRRLVLPLSLRGRPSAMLLFAQVWQIEPQAPFDPESKIIECETLEEGLTALVDLPRLSRRDIWQHVPLRAAS